MERTLSSSGLFISRDRSGRLFCANTSLLCLPCLFFYYSLSLLFVFYSLSLDLLIFIPSSIVLYLFCNYTIFTSSSVLHCFSISSNLYLFCSLFILLFLSMSFILLFHTMLCVHSCKVNVWTRRSLITLKLSPERLWQFQTPTFTAIRSLWTYRLSACDNSKPQLSLAANTFLVTKFTDNRHWRLKDGSDYRTAICMLSFSTPPHPPPQK
jgi:hypothetical protein